MFKKLSVLLVLCVFSYLMGGSALAAGQTDGQTITRSKDLTPAKGSQKFFTGDVTVTQLYPANNEMRSSGGSVTFQPGAR